MSIGGGTNKSVGEVVDNLDNSKITYRAGEVVLQKGGNNINYTYSPSVSAKATYAVAYEYSFENTMNKAVAINLKSIDTTGVTVSYVYSDSKLDLTSDIESETTFKLQQLPNKGDEVYIYVLVSPTDVSIPTTFTTSIVWYYGLPQELIIEGVNGTSTTKTIVNGQELSANDIPQPTAPEGYYFDTYFLDKEHTKLAGDNFRAGKTLYARYANLPSDYIAYDSEQQCYYIIQGTTSLSAELVIPATYNIENNGEGEVVYIAEAIGGQPYGGVFYGQTITSAILPSTLVNIGSFAFEGVTSLEMVDFTSCVNLSKIGSYAFQYCSGLISVDLTNCINLEIIRDRAFQGISVKSFGDLSKCTKLHTIEIRAFADCTQLTSVYLPSSLTTLGIEVFYKCSKLVDVDLSKCVKITEIPVSFFAGSGLVSITLPDHITTISETVFGNCYNLTTVNLSKNLIKIDNYAFIDNYNLQLNFKDCSKLETIGQSAFNGCTNLGEVDLSNTSVTTIGDYGFWGCRALTRVLTSPNLTTIGTDAFRDCNALSEVYDLSTSLEITRFSTNNGYIGCYAEVVNTNINAETRIEKIDGMAYYNDGDSGYIALTPIDRYNAINIKLDKRTTYIRSCAFAYCPKLQNINMDNCVNLTNIGTFAFAGSENLTSIKIPTTVIHIGRYSFNNCTSLTSIRFVDSDGWYKTTSSDDADNKVNGTSIDVSDASQNAIWFRETNGYYEYHLYKVN